MKLKSFFFLPSEWLPWGGLFTNKANALVPPSQFLLGNISNRNISAIPLSLQHSEKNEDEYVTFIENELSV